MTAGNRMTLFQDNTESNVDIAATYGLQSKRKPHSRDSNDLHPVTGSLTRDSLSRHESATKQSSPQTVHRSKDSSSLSSSTTLTRSTRHSKSSRNSRRTAESMKHLSNNSPRSASPTSDVHSAGSTLCGSGSRLGTAAGNVSKQHVDYSDNDNSRRDRSSTRSFDVRSEVSVTSQRSHASRGGYSSSSSYSHHTKALSTPRSRYSSRRSSVASSQTITHDDDNVTRETATPTGNQTTTTVSSFQRISPPVPSTRSFSPPAISERTSRRAGLNGSTGDALGSTFSIGKSESSIEDITSLADAYEDDLEDESGTPPLSNQLISANATDPLSESIDLSELERDAF